MAWSCSFSIANECAKAIQEAPKRGSIKLALLQVGITRVSTSETG